MRRSLTIDASGMLVHQIDEEPHVYNAVDPVQVAQSTLADHSPLQAVASAGLATLRNYQTTQKLLQIEQEHLRTSLQRMASAS
jgi:hypothetical protein